MLGGGSLTLFHVRGIRIAVDLSWFLVLFLFIFWLTGFYKDILGAESGDTAPYALAVASSLLFFTSILLHELGHAFVALRNGIGIQSIHLWMFGGIARIDRDAKTPGEEFRVGVAGPLVTLAIAVVLCGVGLAVAGPDDFGKAMRVEGDAGTSGVMAMVAWLASINILLLAFNLIPAYPMDGGRIAQSIVWWRTGNRNRATEIAAAMGQGFAYLFIAIGIYLVFSGDAFSGIWLGLIGFMLSQAAGAARVQSKMSSQIGDVRVADVMDREPVAIPDKLSAEQALDEYFLRYRWPWFPVVDAAQRFRGLLNRTAVDAVPESGRDTATVADLTEADRDGKLHVRDDTPLEQLLANQTLRQFGALMAVDADGKLSGVITIEQVARAVKGALGGAGS